ncbi:hypothetical protein TevJSym_aw00220 [endosymbiont of Tevnia jerichonana (vent Tica)]|uniref:Uncharacterized protein n=1 Tax=endosymbiont of Tevnia jerichonana (vent Tica) TaxID=1049564 RepID=G2FHM9_9GAMM|nr:hypothetical protein TevJSym_aw00220 [endosymbiont of Tevnia jerichonana (vent Tica)]
MHLFCHHSFSQWSFTWGLWPVRIRCYQPGRPPSVEYSRAPCNPKPLQATSLPLQGAKFRVYL